MLHKKKNTLGLIFILGVLLLPACQKSPSASHVALTYYELIIKQNTSDIISLGISDETAKAIATDIKENLHTQISEKLDMNGRISIANSKITQVEEAYLASLQKLHATASDQKEDDCSLVTLSTSYIDYAAIDEAATLEALNEVDIRQFSDQALYLSTLTDVYISYLVSGYQNAEPSKTYNESTFTFTLQNGLWLPDDYDAFTTELCNLVSTSNKMP